jgi:DNA-binding MarR family transcriptional regulator
MGKSTTSARPKAPAEGATDTQQLSAQVAELMGHVHRRSAGDTLALLNETGLTLAQLVTLHCLQFVGTQSISRIATTLRLSPAATSHLVDRLVKAGMVGRKEDPEDRRAKRVAITTAGDTFAKQVEETRTREFARVLARLSPALRRRLFSVLALVNRELASLPEEPRT